MSNTYFSNKNSNSNFDGDWNGICKYCGRTHGEHISKEYSTSDYTHRMPCEPHRAAMMKDQRQLAVTANSIVLFIWILVPLAIAILGFANFWVGLALFIFSLFQIVWRTVKFFGNPEEWLPGYKDKKEKERKREHYIYHCELNPKGFERLKLENAEKRLKESEESEK